MTPDVQAAVQRASQVLDYVRQHPGMPAEVRNMLLQNVLTELVSVMGGPVAVAPPPYPPSEDPNQVEVGGVNGSLPHPPGPWDPGVDVTAYGPNGSLV
jgi:hypothetical protein